MDPDPHRNRENGSGTDPGNIKSSENKGGKQFFLFLQFFIRFITYSNLSRKNVTGGIKLTEIVHQELDPDPDPFFLNADPLIRIRIHRCGSKDPDPDPYQPMRIQGPDLHQHDADPQH